MKPEVPSIGVEEEYQLVDPNSGQLRPDCKKVMREIKRREGKRSGQSEIVHELHLNQIEMASPICKTLGDARNHLSQTRQTIIDAAASIGAAMASAATHPMTLPTDNDIAPKERYAAMTNQYQQIASHLYIYGCHVHVSMPDRNRGVDVMNRCRQMLPLLQALTANSPYWDGRDTGYDSYRREMWMQWPMAGPPPRFDSAGDYDSAVQRLVTATAIRDATNVYWDIRLPDKVPTIEFRAADAMTSIEETVGYVGLVRGIVMTAMDEIDAGETVPTIDDYLLKYAIWHAARYGVNETIIDPVVGTPTSMKAYVDTQMKRFSAALSRSGDLDSVMTFVSDTMEHGNGAKRQRAASGHRHDDVYDQPGAEHLQKVVHWTVEQTAAGLAAA